MITFATKSHQLMELLEAEIADDRLVAGDAVPSQNELARRHGVSVATVRDAFSALEYRGLIHRVQGKGTFVTEKSARREYSGARRRGFAVGLVMGSVEHPYYAELASVIESAARAAGISLLINMHSHDALDKREALGRLESESLEAIIIGPINDQKEWEFVTQGKLPRHALTFSCMSAVQTHSVTTDRAAGTFAALAYLHRLGHTRIALLTGERKEFTWGRLRGFKRGLKSLHLDPQHCPIVFQNDLSTQVGGHDAARGVLALPANERPTALLMHNDVAAMGALFAARECGLSVPRDVSVVGFDDIAGARYAAVPLTTVDIKIAQTGQLVMEILAELLGEKTAQTTPRQILLQPELVIRESSAAPPDKIKPGQSTPAWRRAAKASRPLIVS